jgi:hypothetical protein
MFHTDGRLRPTSERMPFSPSMTSAGGDSTKSGIGFRGSSLSDAPSPVSVPAGRYQVKAEQLFDTPTKSPEAKTATHRSSFAWGGAPAVAGTATPDFASPTTAKKTFSMSNFFAHGKDAKLKLGSQLPPTAPFPAAPQRRGSYSNATATMAQQAQVAAKAQDDSALPMSHEMSTLMKIFHMRKRRNSKDSGEARLRADSPSTMSVGSLSNAELRMAGYYNEQEALMDPIFNLMDNYKALLCCAFLHAGLIDSLYFLGVNGATQIALKARRLMVSYLRTMAYLFPEDVCSELLTIPSLIEFAASVSTTKTAKRAHKSSQMLITLAEAFTLMPFKQVSGSHISGLSLSVKMPRNSILSPTAAAANKALPLTVNPSPAVMARANFPPLNIQTIFELAEEIKIASFTTIASGESTVDGTCSVVAGVNGSSVAAEVLNNLRNSLTPEIDKNDFVRQMDLSRVIGNQVQYVVE